MEIFGEGDGDSGACAEAWGAHYRGVLGRRYHVRRTPHDRSAQGRKGSVLLHPAGAAGRWDRAQGRKNDLPVLLKAGFSMILFQVNYINAHATSTRAGDMAEVNAIKSVFNETSHIKMKEPR
jgi:hypothetical protein